MRPVQVQQLSMAGEKKGQTSRQAFFPSIRFYHFQFESSFDLNTECTIVK